MLGEFELIAYENVVHSFDEYGIISNMPNI